MSVSYLVMYRGRARNAGEFVRRYRDVHVPILKTWPGVQDVTLHLPVSWVDPKPVEASGLALMCQMTFPDLGALNAALRSEARALAREDFERFPPFEGEVLHQAATSIHFR
jgi:uncharacterized protein (TIGR02118 family)